MDHQKASELFSSYLDNELLGAQRAELEQHLAVCTQCRTELEEFRRAVGGLTRMNAQDHAPPTFLPEIQRQIYLRSRGRFFGKRWKLFGRIPFEWVSLATLIAMLVSYILHMHGAPTGVKPAL